MVPGMRKAMSFTLLLVTSCTFDGSNSVGGDAQSDAPNAMVVDASLLDAALFDAVPIDAAFDAVPPMPCPGDAFGFTLLNMDRCDPTDPIGPLVLSMRSSNSIPPHWLDSDSGVLTYPNGSSTTLDHSVITQPDGSELFILNVNTFEIQSNSRLRLEGSRPVAILSTTDIKIAGRLLAFGRGSDEGVGANLDAPCVTSRGTDGVEQTANGAQGGSGGGGGGFASVGGFGNEVIGSGGGNALGGAVASSLNLVPLRGGCSGGNGGLGVESGLAGGAGGAIQLVAANAITVGGKVSASGGGGRRALASDPGGGGGGGGSGGGILFQADSMVVADSARITVNGGAGAEATRSNDVNTSSRNGENGHVADNNPAVGGTGLANGGDGGDGATPESPAGNGGPGQQAADTAPGGGGGGGGVGVIRRVLVNL